MRNRLQNLRHGLRMMRKSPGITAAVLLTLALGIGATTAIFTGDYATLLAPLPYEKPEQLVIVWSKIGGERNEVSAGDFADWKRQATAFQDMHAWVGGNFNVATHDQPGRDTSKVASTLRGCIACWDTHSRWGALSA
jgi:hypothetical protein